MATATEPQLPTKEELELYIKTNEVRLELARKARAAEAQCDGILKKVTLWFQYQQRETKRTTVQRNGFIISEEVKGKVQLSYKDICIERLGAAEVDRLAAAQPDKKIIRITRSHV